MDGGGLSHLDEHGQARMVDVSEKQPTLREAHAETLVVMSAEALAAASAGNLPKGDVVSVARIAGIMGAKQTPSLVPLCHPLALSNVDVDVAFDQELPGLRITSEVRCTDRTGVEMEALTACAVAALAAVDMVKAVDPWVHVEGLRVMAKLGGRSGPLTRPEGV